MIKKALILINLTFWINLSNGQVVPISSTCLDAFRSAALNTSNVYRAKHVCSKLKQNLTLQNLAQAYADKLATKIKILIYSGNDIGENIFYKAVKQSPTDKYCASKIKLFNFIKLFF